MSFGLSRSLDDVDVEEIEPYEDPRAERVLVIEHPPIVRPATWSENLRVAAPGLLGAGVVLAAGYLLFRPERAPAPIYVTVMPKDGKEEG